jgi:uncharacterized membrane protein YfcA
MTAGSIIGTVAGALLLGVVPNLLLVLGWALLLVISAVASLAHRALSVKQNCRAE